MNIAFIISNKSEFNISNYNNQEIGRAKALANLGNNIDIYVYSKYSTEENVIYENNGCKVKLIPYKGIKILGNQTIPINLIKKLKLHKYNYAHIHEYPWILPAIAATFLKKQGTKTILVQGMYENFKGKSKSVYNRIYDKLILPTLIKNLHGIIFKTSMAQSYFKGKGIINIPTTVIPVGLDTDSFNVNPSIPVDNITQKKIQSHSKKILYIGILEPRRNPLFLIDVFEKLATHDKEYLLIVIGKGPQEREVQKSIIDKQLNEQVIIIPSLRQEQLPWIYNQCNLLVLPSSYEIFGMVLLEALYFQLAIITTPTAGALEVLKGAKYSYIKDLNHNEWIKIIKEYFSKHPTQHPENRQYFESQFQWKDIAQSFTSFYNKL